jgi:hypothetical protein
MSESEPRAEHPPLPSVLFNALLKSASTYITDMLVRGLGAHRTFLTVGIFPGDLLLFTKIQSFARGGQVAQQHFPASPENIAYLAKFSVPVVIHARDPRAVILSWTHHLASAEGGLDELFWYYPAICPPPEFLARHFAWQLDWCVENLYDQLVTWLLGWCDAADRGLADIAFTSFEQFTTDRAGFFRTILDHAGVPPGVFKDPGTPPGAGHLFRRGLVDEWRTIMDATQARRVTEAMPDRLWGQFGWGP